MERGPVGFGILALIIGLGAGYFMYTQPEGLNPDWPIWMALLAPALFVLAGLHMIAAGLNRPRLADAMIRALLVCLLAVVHWAAFFTTHQCVVTVSFLGAKVFDWYPSEEECRRSLQALVASIDTLIIMVVGAFLWHKHRASRKEPLPPPANRRRE